MKKKEYLGPEVSLTLLQTATVICMSGEMPEGDTDLDMGF